MTETAQQAGEAPDTATVLTFLIADIRGYTRFTMQQGDAAAARLAGRFAELVEEAAADHAGRVIELRGDEALSVFSSARQALRAAVALQNRLAAEARDDLPLRAGVGLDAGEAVPVKGGYRGAALNLAARLCSLATAGETLASETIVNLARKIEGIEYDDRGYTDLKGFGEPVKVVLVRSSREQVNTEDVPAEAAGDISASQIPYPQPRESQNLPIGGFLGALPSGDLVAREAERARILATIDAVAAGKGRILLISGEAGVGKTRLAQETTLLARNRGFTVLTGRCYESYQAVPFFPFQEAMTQAYEAVPRGMRAEVFRRWPHLGRVLPDVFIPTLSPAANSHEEQQRLFWSVTSFLQSMSTLSPVAILLDDLHWADSSSLELLQHLARLTRGAPILMVGTYRETEIGPQHPLQRIILDLERERLVERVPVRPLDRSGTEALMAARMGDEEISTQVTDLVHRHTEGNPFFTQEVLRTLVERGEIYRQDGEWVSRPEVDLDVPDTVRAAIDMRLSMLGNRAREALNSASVLGQTFSFDDLHAMLEFGEEEVETALDQSLSAGLVRVGKGDEYSFNHVLTQQALYTELSPHRKRRLHLAAGNALERLPESARERRATELAHHFLEGGDAERGLPHAVHAGDSAEAVFAHADAATHYGTALELARRIGDRAQEARVREKLGGLLTATIRYSAALEMLDEAATLYRAGAEWESEGRVVAQIGRVHVVDGSVDAGLSRLSAFYPILAAHGPTRALANLVSSLAHLYFALGRYEEALATASEAADLAQGIGDLGVRGEAEARRGATLGMLGRLEEAVTSLQAAVGFAELAGDVFTRCRALQVLAGVSLTKGELERCREFLDGALRLADHMGNRRQIAVSHYGLSLQALAIGDPDGSSLHAERALTIMHSLEGSWRTACQIPGLDPLSLSHEVTERAGQYLRECVAVSSRMDSTPHG